MPRDDLATEAEILAEFRATTVVFPRTESSTKPLPVLTDEERAEGRRLAQKYEREHPEAKPCETITISRESGAIVGFTVRPATRQATPRLPMPAAVARRCRVARPRGRR